MNNGLRFGLWAGVISILYITLLYVYNEPYLVSGYERVTLLLFLGFMGAAIHTERSLHEEGFAEFSQLFGTTFRVYAIGFLMKFAYIYILFNFIDPDLVELIKDAQVRLFIENRDPDIPEHIFEQNVKLFSEQDFSPSIDLLGIALELMLGAIMAGILAFVFKREQPDF